MHRKFSDFIEHKQSEVFANNFQNLCENIVLSGVSFDEYWEQIIPVLMESTSITEEELLFELGLPRWLGGQPSPDVAGGMSQSYRDQQAAQQAQKDSARQAKLQQFQGNINQSVQHVKNRFVQSMRDFIQTMTSDAKQNNDWLAWKVAKAFYDKIMKLSQPVIDDFSMKAKYGKRDTSDFDRERSALNQSQQQGMKQQLQQKFGGNYPQPRMTNPTAQGPANATA